MERYRKHKSTFAKTIQLVTQLVEVLPSFMRPRIDTMSPQMNKHKQYKNENKGDCEVENKFTA